MNQYIKGVLIGFLSALVAMCLCFLFSTSMHNTLVFISQSIIDNAIFCIMFIAVVLITGISC